MANIPDLKIKNEGRFPVILPDVSEPQNPSTGYTPFNHELFINYSDIDIIFYDSASSSYISFMDKIRGSLTWKPPVDTYSTILTKYTNPSAMTVVPVIDTGIIYSYIGNGVWIPISINALKIVSTTNDGLLSKDQYAALNGFYTTWKDNLPTFYNRYNGSTKLVYTSNMPATKDTNTMYAQVYASVNKTVTISNGVISLS